MKHKPAPLEPRSFTADAIEALTALREGKKLIDRTLTYVSHGGPTRKDAEAWSEKAAKVLAKYPNLP